MIQVSNMQISVQFLHWFRFWLYGLFYQEKPDPANFYTSNWHLVVSSPGLHSTAQAAPEAGESLQLPSLLSEIWELL